MVIHLVIARATRPSLGPKASALTVGLIPKAAASRPQVAIKVVTHGYRVALPVKVSSRNISKLSLTARNVLRLGPPPVTVQPVSLKPTTFSFRKTASQPS